MLWVFGVTMLNNLSGVKLSGIQYFVVNVSFHLELFGLANFGLDLGSCIVNLVMLINKYFVNLFRISLYELLRRRQHTVSVTVEGGGVESSNL